MNLESVQIVEDLDIREIEKLMEEMAGAPREEMGKRQPGEKCKYEEYSKLPDA